MKTKMNNKVKALLMACCAVLLVFASVLGTLAYLTDSTKTVTNTFTVGNVQIKLTEAKVDPETGKALEGEKAARIPNETDTTATNEYKIIPGRTIDKDPTVTVVAGSEPCYVRMMVTVKEMSQLTKAFPKDTYANYYATIDGNEVFLLQKLVNWDSTNWACESYAAGVYEFRYIGTAGNSTDWTGAGVVDAREITTSSTKVNGVNGIDLEPLFTTVIVPGEVTGDQLTKLNDISIEIVAEAIQAEGLADADAAWAEFKTQNPTA